jgi:hypothetical protein
MFDNLLGITDAFTILYCIEVMVGERGTADAQGQYL